MPTFTAHQHFREPLQTLAQTHTPRRLLERAQLTAQLDPALFTVVNSRFSTATAHYCEFLHTHPNAPLALFSTKVYLERPPLLHAQSAGALGWAHTSNPLAHCTLPFVRALPTLERSDLELQISDWSADQRIVLRNPATSVHWLALRPLRAARVRCHQQMLDKVISEITAARSLHFRRRLGLFIVKSASAGKLARMLATPDALPLVAELAMLHGRVATIPNQSLQRLDATRRFHRSIDRLVSLAKTHAGFSDLCESLIEELTMAHARFTKTTLSVTLNLHGLHNLGVDNSTVVPQFAPGLRLAELESVAASFAVAIDVNNERQHLALDPAEIITHFDNSLAAATRNLDAYKIRVYKAHQLIRAATFRSHVIDPFGDDTARRLLLRAEELLES